MPRKKTKSQQFKTDLTKIFGSKLPDKSAALAPPNCSASVLHISYRSENGEVVGLQVGGIDSDDAINAIRTSLDEGAVAVTIIRETLRMQNEKAEARESAIVASSALMGAAETADKTQKEK